MDQEWYYTIGGRQTGPISLSELNNLAITGQLLQTDMIWKTGMPGWVKANNLSGLFDTPNPDAPPPIIFSSEFEQSITYAGFWKRFAAFIIDLIIIAVCPVLIIFSFGIILDLSEVNNLEMIDKIHSYISIAVPWLYFSLMESSPMQATLGKMAFGIKVTDLNGKRVSFGKATGRHIGKIISMFTFFVVFLMIAFTNKKQGLSDMIAGCLVVNK